MHREADTLHRAAASRRGGGAQIRAERCQWADSGERNTVCLLVTNSPFFCFSLFWKRVAGLLLRPTEAKILHSLDTWGKGRQGSPGPGRGFMRRKGRSSSATCSWAAAWKMPVGTTTYPASQDSTLPFRFHPLKIKLTRSSYGIQARYNPVAEQMRAVL